MTKHTVVTEEVGINEEVIEWKLEIYKATGRPRLYARNPGKPWVAVLGLTPSGEGAILCGAHHVKGLKTLAGRWEIS